jgi:HSP20 family protein
MKLVKVNPNQLVNTSIFDDFDRVFDGFLNSKPLTQDFKPSVNVIEEPEAFRLQLAAPGLTREDFEIELDKDVLNISVNKEFKLQEGETIRRREFGDYDFKRSFRLSELIEADSINATYENGVLNIELPKAEEAKEKPARKIEIA